MEIRWLRAPIALVAMTLACAGGQGEPPREKLRFLDSKIFDNQLSRSLAADLPRVQIDFLGADVSINRLPERIDTWLSVIAKEDESRVRVLPDPRYPVPKSVAGIAITLGIQLYGHMANYLFYRPAQEYDATVYYVPETGRLTSLVFDRRAE